MEITFDIEEQTILRTDCKTVIADSENYLTAKFTFSSEWDGLTKTAIFNNATLGINSEVVLNDDECVVPSEMIKPNSFVVSVYGGDLITANTAQVTVLASGKLPTNVTYVKTKTDETAGFNKVDYLNEKDGAIEFSIDNGVTYQTVGSEVSSVNGKKGTVILKSADINSDYEPTNYTNTDNTLDGHLTGINNELGTLENIKEPKFPNPAVTTRQYLYYENGERFVGDIVIGGGSAAATIYLTNNISTTVGTYKELSYSLPSAETIVTKTLSAVTSPALIETYIFDDEFGDNIIDAGKWTIAFKGFVNSASNTTYLRAVVFTRATNGTETTLFTINGADINNTTIGNIVLETIESGYVVDPAVKLGCRIYAVTDKTSDVTLTYYKGNGNAAYIDTPLALRHTQLRDINGDPNYQHLTTEQIANIPQIITLPNITLTAADWYTDGTTGKQAHKITNAEFTSATTQELNVWAADDTAEEAMKTAGIKSYSTQIMDSGTATLIIYSDSSIPTNITLKAQLIKGVQA